MPGEKLYLRLHFYSWGAFFRADITTNCSSMHKLAYETWIRMKIDYPLKDVMIVLHENFGRQSANYFLDLMS